jgi:hypothetical protein
MDSIAHPGRDEVKICGKTHPVRLSQCARPWRRRRSCRLGVSDLGHAAGYANQPGSTFNVRQVSRSGLLICVKCLVSDRPIPHQGVLFSGTKIPASAYYPRKARLVMWGRAHGPKSNSVAGFRSGDGLCGRFLRFPRSRAELVRLGHGYAIHRSGSWANGP